METLQSKKSHCTRGECKKAFGPKHTLVQDHSACPERQRFVCSKCGKKFKYKPSFIVHRKPTLVTGFMSVVTVGNLSEEAQPSFNIEEFILGQGSTSAANVGNPLAKNLSSFILRGVTLEKIAMYAIIVHSLLARAPSLFNNGQFTLEKSVINALSARSPLNGNLM
ncbi:hypothetical protein MG293_015925 [Ovis ammon polii]|uniref:C2H2-type domain-containing protein n=1 Tax=Ovis ammon polii TaxID=230172 RepID=A0AAD4TZQ9_OVIAM|nr:hypothetical protein MG293_015925 [Ovis ammon polii]